MGLCGAFFIIIGAVIEFVALVVYVRFLLGYGDAPHVLLPTMFTAVLLCLGGGLVQMSQQTVDELKVDVKNATNLPVLDTDIWATTVTLPGSKGCPSAKIRAVQVVPERAIEDGDLERVVYVDDLNRGLIRLLSDGVSC